MQDRISRIGEAAAAVVLVKEGHGRLQGGHRQGCHGGARKQASSSISPVRSAFAHGVNRLWALRYRSNMALIDRLIR
jgi:hypothetical protein